MKTAEKSTRPDSSGPICANCRHPKSDHPMHDACWHTIQENKKVRLCFCRGYQSALQARAACGQNGLR
jgi:hypothetical protein